MSAAKCFTGLDEMWRINFEHPGVRQLLPGKYIHFFQKRQLIHWGIFFYLAICSKLNLLAGDNVAYICHTCLIVKLLLLFAIYLEY